MAEPFSVRVPRVHARARGYTFTGVISFLAEKGDLLATAPDGRQYLRLHFGAGDVLDIYHGDRLTTEVAGSVWLHWWTRVRSIDFAIPEDAPPWPKLSL